ncbi:MAG: hypothetical protein R3A79_03500 [Nannocystaceae bacterium]
MRNALWMSTLAVLVSCSGGNDGASESSDTVDTATAATATTATSTGPTTDTTATGTTEMSTGTAAETTTSADGAPFFISFSTNVGQITEGESVVFTAVVSDPDGFDDIAGGTLFTQDGAFSYGPFVSAGQEGTYSITVSWADVDQVETIEFEDFSLDRVFRAEFFDMDGHKVSQDTTIALQCDGGGACDGSCKDFQSDEANCGACGKLCSGGCGGGMCLPIYGECIVEGDGFLTCDDFCQTAGEQCVEAGCDGNTVKGYVNSLNCSDDAAPNHYSEPCGQPQPWGPGRNAVRCCCSDTN